MTSKTFKPGTVIDSDWLNDVNSTVYGSAANVRLFGAVGDGVADDSAAFQAAINAAGGEVYVPSGTYRINSAVTLKHKVSLRGDGKAASEIYFGASGRLTLTGTVSTPVGKLAIRHIGLTNQGGGAATGLVLSRVERVVVEDCVIYNTSVSVSGFNYVTFNMCDLFGGAINADHPDINSISEMLKLDKCNGSGYAVNVKDSADTTIIGTHLLGPTAQINIQRGEQNSAFYPPVFISDTVVDSGDNEGIYLVGVSPHLSNVFASSGRTNLKSGIYLFDCVEGSLSNVTSRFCGQHGIWVGGCNGLSFSGCAFNDNKQYGVRIGDSTNLRFLGCQMKNAPSWYGGSYPQQTGIADDPSNCTNVIFIANDVTGNIVGPTYLPGATHIIANNKGV